MKALKILGGLIALAIVVVGLVVFIGLQNINGIVKTAVETVGPDVLGTEVRLQAVDIEITNGRGELHGLTIANPKGFSASNAFELGKVALQVDPASLTGDVIVIDEITITGAQLLAELKGIGETNLQALMDNIQSGDTSNSAPQKADKPNTDSGESVKLAIKSFTFSDSNIELMTEEWGNRTIKLPAVKVNNIGTQDNGLTPEQLAEAMIQPILKSAEESIKDDLEKLAKEKAEEKLKQKLNEKLGSEKTEQLNQLKSLFGN